jgi:CCR4-Not complex component, Not1/CCR4-NOT transcription complex subunit 1 CAF1-binding domain/Domain of unknown function (DUF3819)/CCR4-NOT transcription complex subunit 1 TTP binding domain/CCR4-NOT transcription complex subunit 1 HEAT repeat
MVSFTRLSSAATSEAPAAVADRLLPPSWLAESAVAPPGISLPPALAAAADDAEDAYSTLASASAQDDPPFALPENLLHRLLIDLGPSSTLPDHMASLRAALAPFGRPQESAVARAILVMAATAGSRASAPDVNSDSGIRVEVPTVFQMFRLFASSDGGGTPPSPPPQQLQQPAVDSSDWNPESLVRVVTDLADASGTPIDWSAVLRHLDVAELPSVLNVHSLQVILHAFSIATGRPVLPGESLVGRWTNANAQLAMLNCVLTLPGSVNWETVKPAVESAPEDAASPFRCIPLIEALVDLDARNLLQAAVTASPDLVLLALAKSSPQVNGSIRQQLLVPLLSSRLASFPETSETVKHMWAISRPVMEVGLQQLWQGKNGSVTRVLEIVHFLGALPHFLSSAAAVPVPFAVELAVAAFRQDTLNLESWLTGRLVEGGISFLASCVLFLSETLASPGYPVAQAMPLEAAAIIFKCLFKALPVQRSGTPQAEIAVDLRRIYDVFVSLNARLGDLSIAWGTSGNRELPVGVQTGSDASACTFVEASPRANAGKRRAGDLAPLSLDEVEAFPPEVDAEADKHYKRLYQEEMSVEQTVELLQKLRASSLTQNQQVYRCMIHTLFDEYRFLTKYPDRELRITGTLFGALAQYSVLAGQELGILLKHILEALSSVEPEPLPIGRLAKFGMCALERCRARLSDFPMFCECVLRISRLHTIIPELLNEVSLARRAGSSTAGPVAPSEFEIEIGAPWLHVSQSKALSGGLSHVPLPLASLPAEIAATGAVTGPSTMASSLAPLSTPSETTGVSPATSRDVGVPAKLETLSPLESARNTPQKSSLRPSPSGDGTFQFATVNMETLLTAQQQSMDVPDSSTQDKIHFIFNNLSTTNMSIKEDELMEFLETRHADFFAHYVVVKRASIEPNFHNLYITFLTRIAKHVPKLFTKVFEKSFTNVRILLDSEKIVSSSSERLLLKSLGSWIGALTLARNKPLLRGELDIKKLLLDAYSNGRLIAVVPFVSKLLVMSKGSLIFKPTNPWLQAILRLLREIYLVPDLKLNVKFELPLLTKELGIDANEIKPSDLLGSRPAPMRDGNPDFTAIKKQSGIASPVRSASPHFSPVRSSARGNPRTGESFAVGDGTSDVPTTGRSGVPIFSLGGIPSPGGAAIGAIGALREMPAVMSSAASLGGGGVRASVPGSDTVADLAAIMASSSLSSGTAQQLHGSTVQRYGGGRNGGGAAAAAAAVAQQAAAAAAANENMISPLVQPIFINQSLVLFQTAPHLKGFVSPAIDRAVQEIINPVVERSCAIATITTRELALKDFAHELDAMKIQRAAKQMVQHLAGSLALVTCKEPLRVSMGNQLRPALSPAAAGDSNLLEQTIQVLCTANLEAGCAIIEQAATEKAARDINEVIAPVFSARRQQHHQRYGAGLLGVSSAQDVLRVYDDFARLPRTVVTPGQVPGMPPSGTATMVPLGHQPGTAMSKGQNGVSGQITGGMDPAPVGSLGTLSQAELPAAAGAGGAFNSVAGMKASGYSGLANGADPSIGAVVGGSVLAQGPSPTAVSAAKVMASPSAMAEAMRYATANAPSLSSFQSMMSSSVVANSGEDKLSTQQVLEQFNTVYPQLTAAIASAVDAYTSSKTAFASGTEPANGLSQVDLPVDHDVHRLRMQITQAVKRSLTAEEASTAVAQKVFKRLYEGNSNLYRDVHVSLLESMRECSRRLSKELVSWLAYSEDSKKLNRECAVALLRPGSLLHITSYDELVAKTCDNGRNPAAVEFAAFLVQRVIIEEPLTTTRELYLTLEVLTKVGRRSSGLVYPSAPNGLNALVDACRSVVHRPVPSPSMSNSGFNSVGSMSSSTGGGFGGGALENHVSASMRAAKGASEAEALDPPESRETVASVLTEWQRVLSAGTLSHPVPDRVIASFVIQAKPTTMYNEEARDRFFRIGIDLVCFATSSALSSRGAGNGGPGNAMAKAPYTPVEAMVRLVAAVCKPETSGESAANGVAMLGVYLQALVRCIVKATHGGDVRPHFRLFIGVIVELARGLPAVDSGGVSAGAALEQDGASASGSVGEGAVWNGLEPGLPGRSSDSLGGQAGGSELSPTAAHFQVLSTFANALNACNPNVAPAFAFSWLQIVANPDVMPRLLAYRSGKGWRLLRQLIVSMLSFLYPHLSKVGPESDIPPPILTLYRGTLRVLLVLLHDFPEFLCDYHFALCDVIPPSCIQMRNLVLSAYPRSMRLPDPFLPNLKVDKLEEMSNEPRVLSNLTTSLVTAGIKAPVDKFLHEPTAQNAASLGLHTKLATRDKQQLRYNVPAINALVLYLGQQSMSKIAPGSPPVVNGPSMEVLRALLLDVDLEGRYHLLNAIANQLRFPNLHTHYFSCVLLFLFKNGSNVAVKEQITRVLVERLIANRPHPWGLLITFIELIKNTEYGFWNHDFVRCAPQIEQLFENVVRFALSSSAPPGGGNSGAEAQVHSIATSAS